MYRSLVDPISCGDGYTVFVGKGGIYKCGGSEDFLKAYKLKKIINLPTSSIVTAICTAKGVTAYACGEKVYFGGVLFGSAVNYAISFSSECVIQIAQISYQRDIIWFCITDMGNLFYVYNKKKGIINPPKEGIKFLKVSMDAYYSSNGIVMTDKGWFTFGFNDNFMTGSNKPIIISDSPFESVKIIDEKIIDVKCGEAYGMFLTEEGNCYVRELIRKNQVITKWGMYKRVRILKGENEKIISIDCGERYFLAVGGSGRPFKWGADPCGTFSEMDEDYGSKYENFSDKFGEIRTSTKTCKFIGGVCGDDCAFVYTGKGEVYVYGKNCKGELGVDISPVVDKLCRVENLKVAVNIEY